MKYTNTFIHLGEHRDLFRSHIHTIESFIDEQMCEELIQVALVHHSADNKYAGYATRYLYKENHEIITHINKNIEELASALFGKTLIISESTKVRSLPPEINPGANDGYMHSHCDSEHIDGSEIDLSKTFVTYDNEVTPLLNEITALLYLNDDFVGGEIEFSEYDLKIRPKKGMLLIFPSGHQYMHQVKEVKSGTRFFCTTFLTSPKIIFLFNQIKQNH